MSTTVHALHQKYGTLYFILGAHMLSVPTGSIVRLTPQHVSVADPEALQAIYGQASGALKSDLYEAFLVYRTSMFTTRSRLEHVRKRKYTSHAMSMKNITEFEPNVREHQLMLVKRFDALCAAGEDGLDGVFGSSTWKTDGGRVWFDCMWCKYLSWKQIK